MQLWSDVDLTALVVTSARLTLRPLTDGDAPDIERAMQDRSMHEFLPLPDPYLHSDAESYIRDVAAFGRARGTALHCAAQETATGRLVGTGCLFLPIDRITGGEIGYSIYPWARGNGYATELSRALGEWGFAYGLERIEIRCAVANIHSAAAAMRAGFRFEGILRHDVRTPRGLVDGAVFGRLAGDSGDAVPPALPLLPRDGIGDGVLTLRAVTAADAEMLFEEAANPESRRWNIMPDGPSRDRIVRAAVQAPLDWLVGPHHRMVMVDAATGQPAGTISLHTFGPPGVGLIGYGVLPAWRGRGFTGRALRLVTRWAFETAGLARLELGADLANLASQRAALAGGFEADGVRAARLPNPAGARSDEATFALVNPSLRSAPTPTPPAG